MFYHAPDPKAAYVIVFYRNFAAANPAYSHVGLGVNGLHTVKVLRKNGIKADLFGVWLAKDITAKLTANPTCTHAVIEAPWVAIADLQTLMRTFPSVHFLVRSHSNIAFLQVEAAAIQLIRQTIALAEQSLNLTMAVNSQRLKYFLGGTYDANCLYLPNLYDVAAQSVKRWRTPTAKDTIKIASFGALRLLKNHTTSAAAALMVAQNLGADLEFNISVNREEHGKGVVQSLQNMFSGLKWATLVQVPWEAWPDFRRTVAGMDLCYQLSFSETFNIVSADAAAAGVPSVVSDAIEWVPEDWTANVDSVEDSARKGAWLINDHTAGQRGLNALTTYNDTATQVWLSYLASNPT